ITANLIPVTLGNIVGGAVLVGLSNWCIFRRPELKAANISSITTTTTLSSVKDFTMKNASFVKDIMNQKPVTIRAETPIAAALDVLLDNHVTSAPVVDVQNRLVGFFSAHDVMVELWCEDYIPVKDQKVVDIMSRDVVAIDADDRLVDVVEFLCIDKAQLYPASSMGIATRLTSLSLE
ncbi:CBS domain-containing protein, partial [Vibrio parahaemolyticus]|nr:CBS domain-containing protein [Vibrio parahaemolyticus]